MTLQAAHAADKASLLTVYPSVEDSWNSAVRLGPVLWWRRPEHPEFLQLRLGLGDVPAYSVPKRSGAGDGVAAYEQQLSELEQEFAKLNNVETLLTETKENAEGLLRVTTTVAFGSVWLTSRLKEFIRAYPGIEVMLRLDDRELDLAMREADVAIRLRRPAQPDLIYLHDLALHPEARGGGVTGAIVERLAEALEKSGVDIVPRIQINTGSDHGEGNGGPLAALIGMLLNQKGQDLLSMSEPGMTALSVQKDG